MILRYAGAMRLALRLLVYTDVTRGWQGNNSRQVEGGVIPTRH